MVPHADSRQARCGVRRAVRERDEPGLTRVFQASASRRGRSRTRHAARARRCVACVGRSGGGGSAALRLRRRSRNQNRAIVQGARHRRVDRAIHRAARTARAGCLPRDGRRTAARTDRRRRDATSAGRAARARRTLAPLASLCGAGSVERWKHTGQCRASPIVSRGVGCVGGCNAMSVDRHNRFIGRKSPDARYGIALHRSRPSPLGAIVLVCDGGIACVRSFRDHEARMQRLLRVIRRGASRASCRPPRKRRRHCVLLRFARRARRDRGPPVARDSSAASGPRCARSSGRRRATDGSHRTSAGPARVVPWVSRRRNPIGIVVPCHRDRRRRNTHRLRRRNRAQALAAQYERRWHSAVEAS